MINFFLPDDELKHRSIAIREAIAVNECSYSPEGMCLHYRDGVLFYGEIAAKLDQVFSFDLRKEWNSHQGKQYSLKKEPLAKSLGIKGDGTSKIIDATCGTGKDSILLLKFGAKVRACERNPVVAALFMDALERALEVDDSFGLLLKNNFSYQFISAVSVEAQANEVIYLDPMYPHPEKKKSALPRKEMQLFRHVVGDDLDANQLFDWAIHSNAARVVVKRPIGAPLLGEHPTYSYEGKSTRYDMYALKSI